MTHNQELQKIIEQIRPDRKEMNRIFNNNIDNVPNEYSQYIEFDNDSAILSDQESDTFRYDVSRNIKSIEYNVKKTDMKILELEKSMKTIQNHNRILQNKQTIYECIIYLCFIYNFFV